MSKKIIALIALLLVIPPSIAMIEVNIYVSSFIDGRMPYHNISELVNDTPHRSTVIWENTGSVGCSFRLRADIYEIVNNTKIQAHTSWSEEKPVEPGDQAELVAYWYPKSPGNFTVRTFLYYCNTIGEGPEANFTVFRSNITAEKPPFEIKTETTESYIEFRFNSREDVKDLVIIPDRYPTGWAFDSKRIGLIEEGKEKIVRLNYEAGIWKEKNVSFDIVAMDGRYYHSKEITIEKKRKEEFPVYPAVAAILLVIVIVLLLMLIRERGINKETD
jgi:hypothetical protein